MENYQNNTSEPSILDGKSTAWTRIKAYFITGVVILLPLAFTLGIVIFLFNLLTEPFVGIVKSILGHYNLLDSGFLFLTSDQIQKVFSQFIILVLLFFFTVSLGIVARWFFFHYLVRIWDLMLAKIPFINGVYRTCQDIIQTLFASSSSSFKQVVMVPFPSPGTLAIGFVTNESIPGINNSMEPLVAVFVPTTPNPTSGFLMMFRESDLVYLDMKVEDALKYVISCGVIPTALNVVTRDHAKNNVQLPQIMPNEPSEG
ncbi:MAG TPA: DUF502 domain-containing protein [Parachlamydiaceae bacterium]|nr:DUF502 domain-containing protein [Parachlamydiaceae bacterium]